MNQKTPAQIYSAMKQLSKPELKSQLLNINEQISVRDMMQREGVTLRIPNRRVSPDDLLISGDFCRKELRKGLFLHAGDAIEKHAFRTDSTHHAGLSCIFFLKGNVDVTIGNHLFDFGTRHCHRIDAAAIIKTTQESFKRETKQPQHVRHLVITAAPEWLNCEGFAAASGKHLNTGLSNNHMHSLRWNPTPRLYTLIQEMLIPSGLMPELFNLYLESRVIEIITEVIGLMMRTSCSNDRKTNLTHYDNVRLQRVRELIATNLDQELNMAFITREAGISASALQRLFHRAEGHSIISYVRRMRLDKAMSVLRSRSVTVQEASTIAGYTNPANFATAFKRQFGMTPREVIRRN